jgi:hypothetical protein
MTLTSGTGISTIEDGVMTSTGSIGLALAVRIKKVSSRKDTSHMAVISTNTEPFFTWIFGILIYFLFEKSNFSF